MESFVERLFRETYRLDEVPDPPGFSPYPLRPSELINLSSPLVELVHDNGNDPESLDGDLCALLRDTPRDHRLLETAASTPSLIAEASDGLDLDTPQVAQDFTNLNGGGSDTGIR